MEMLSTQDVIALLRRATIPITHQRVEIARALFSRPVHVTAEQLLTLVRERAAETSRATVYNTLKLFCEKKMVRELFVDLERVVFDSNPAPHYHLYDVETGQVTDVSAGEISVVGAPALPEGVELEQIDVIIRVRGKKR